MRLVLTCINGQNLIEKVPEDLESNIPGQPDFAGPYYLFERRGQGDRFLDVLLGVSETFEGLKALKEANRYRERYWCEEFRNYSFIPWYVQEAIDNRAKGV